MRYTHPLLFSILLLAGSPHLSFAGSSTTQLRDGFAPYSASGRLVRGTITLSPVALGRTSRTSDLAIPPMIYPPDAGTTPIIPEIIIGSVDGADRYELQVALDQTFSYSSIVSYSFWQISGTTSSGLSIPWTPAIVTPGNYSNNTTYYWRVRSMNTSTGGASAWSIVRRYTTTEAGGPVLPPSLLMPLESSVVSWMGLLLQWQQIPQAGCYQVQWSTSSTFDSFTYTWTLGPTPDVTIYIEPQTIYYWRVIAYNDSSISVFSSGRSFSTDNQVTLTDANGIFDDGSSWKDYRNGLDISWRIKPAGAQRLRLSFDAFSTEAGYDIVTVYDGESLSSPILGEFSGNSLPPPITSSGGTLLLRFKTDGSGTGRGWIVEFHTMEASTKIPIVIVPGIMGSPLFNDTNRDNVLSDAERTWVNFDILNLAFAILNPVLLPAYLLEFEARLNQLRLDETGVNPPAGQQYFIASTPIAHYSTELQLLPLSFYSGLVGALQIRLGYTLHESDGKYLPGENLFIFTYDWRHGVMDAGLQLSRYVDNVKTWTGAAKVDIIAHSLGGLVTKACLKQGQSSFDKVIFAGTPHLGAPDAIEHCFSGSVFGDIGKVVFWPSTMKRLIRNFSSVYQLFPSKRYCDGLERKVILQNDDGTLCTELAFDDAVKVLRDRIDQSTGLTVLNGGLLGTALTFQDNFDNFDFNGIPFSSVVGDGLPTTNRLRLDNAGIVPLKYFNGDGTVPIQSSSSPSPGSLGPIHRVLNKAHNSLCTDPAVCDTIIHILQNPLAKVPATRAFIADNSSDNYQVTARGRVRLHAYDWFERHTGPTSDSTFEEKIPGSQYVGRWLTAMDDTKIIVLPRTSGYKFVVEAAESAVAPEVDVDDIRGGDDAAFVNYHAVAMSATGKASVYLDSVHAYLTLTLDKKGDGTDVVQLAPSHYVTTGAGDDGTQAKTIPLTYQLFQNYPNPFNPSTTIRYDLPQRSHVSMTVCNTLGQQIATLVEGDMEAGYHDVKFDASGLSSGVYFYRMKARDFVQTKKLLLVH